MNVAALDDRGRWVEPSDAGDQPGPDGLAAALAAEHAAVYAYGPVGVWLDGDEAELAREAEQAHRALRDALVLALSERGGPVPGAAAAYELPFPVTDRGSAQQLAVLVEERVAATWRATLGQVEGADRAQALAALTDTAVRATRWRRAAGAEPATVPFPGAA